ncbi:MAG TPA: aminomethyl-transferring glycine dehydrogenase subunit GcvPA [Candidatus Nitrosopolaris sp.]|nr:aminomethyl-transferring glycine dehydrogenase subunit GcvPA [Candidatus Nitrosopolaris sp.]
MDFVPTTKKDQKIMLERIGVDSVDELVDSFRPIISNENLDLPPALTEMQLTQHLKKIAARNKIMRYFVGAGSYNHYIPSALNHLVNRGEFLTGYTPYQAEINQGTLQSMYEFQSFICLLTGMDVANASLYEGASALAEAALMSASYTGRKQISVGNNIHPQYLEVLKTYCEAADLEISNQVTQETACILTQNPDFHGNIENLSYISERAHKVGALAVTCVVEPTSLAIIEPPGNYGADIVVGEGQAFGIPLNFGGPYLGFLAVKNYLLKKIPGRISGMTNDSLGNRGFVLTLQAREQHIRRERATSNITTNVALNALAATVYLALMGRSGLIRVANASYKNAHLLQSKLGALGFQTLNNLQFYNEFLVKTPKSSKDILADLARQEICGGLDLGDDRLLICCTEMNTDQDIRDFVSAAGGI